MRRARGKENQSDCDKEKRQGEYEQNNEREKKITVTRRGLE